MLTFLGGGGNGSYWSIFAVGSPGRTYLLDKCPQKFTMDAHFAWTCALKMTLQLSMGTIFLSVGPRRPSFQSDAIVAGCLCWLAGCIIKIFRGGGMVTP